MRHIAVLMSGAEDDPETQARLAGIRQGLSRFGWSEGRNVEIDYRYASASAEQAQLLAKDLVALKPAVIVAPSSVVAAGAAATSGDVGGWMARQRNARG
jgi:putative ABC transport system substrate-binding protein